MGLKYGFSEVFRGRFPIPQKLYGVLVDLAEQIEKKNKSESVVEKNVKLTKSGLKKVFGNPSDFKSFGVVLNAEGSYLIVSTGSDYKCLNLEDI